MSYTAAGRPGRFKTSKNLACLSSLVLLNSHDLDHGNLRGTATFQLPTDAAPSIQGETVNVDWELRLRLNSAPSQESTTVGHITVLSSPVGTTGDQERLHGSGHRPAAISKTSTARCDVSLALAQDVMRTGQPLRGVLNARAITDINVTKVQAELECLEQAGAKESSAIYSTAYLQGRSSLQARQEYQWPFQLEIPDLMLPSANFDETWVVWRVKGILGRTFRTRLETAAQVQVFTSG